MSEVLNKSNVDTALVKFEKPVGKLFVSIAHDVDLNTIMSEGFIESLTAGITCTLSRVSKDGKSVEPFNALPLSVLFEYDQMSEGTVIVNEDEICGTISIGNGGNIPFNNDETVELTFSGLNNRAIKVNRIDVPVFAEYMPKFTKLAIGSQVTEKEFNVASMESILLPLSDITASTKIHMTATNGKVDIYDKTELLAIGYSTNDLAVLGSKSTGVSYAKSGFDTYAILDVTIYKNIEIKRQSVSPFSIYAQSLIGVSSVGYSRKMNDELKPTV